MDDEDWLPNIRVDALDPYDMGLQIGSRFEQLIKSRISKDPILQSQLMPFAATQEGQQLIEALSTSNKHRYPRYWYELQGLADGSCVSLLEVLLLNFRKEVMPFISSKCSDQVCLAEECSDVSVCNSMAALGHNEDANVSVKDHVFLVHASFSKGASFTAYTYAGELPSCAFGFNTYGVCIQVKELAVGHSYNIFDISLRRIVSVETASRGRFSLREIGVEPFFHANMYRHLNVPQVEDQSSLHRQARAAELPKCTKQDLLQLLGDSEDQDYPIYMQGPSLCTLCTVLVDMDARELAIYKGKPSSESKDFALVFDLTAQ